MSRKNIPPPKKQVVKSCSDDLLINKYFRAWLTIILLMLTVFGIVWRLISPTNFILNVQANSNVVQILRSPESLSQKWRMANAVICMPETSNDALPANLKIISDLKWSEACGRGRTPVYSTDEEQTLTLLAAGKVTLRRLKSGLLSIALRGDKSGEPFAQLSYTQTNTIVPLESRSNILVEPAGLKDDEIAHQSKGIYLFPFAAEVIIGENVRWSAPEILLSGQINIYRDAKLVAGERSKVATEDLIMGDRIKLSFFKRDNLTVFPKGFVRLDTDTLNLDVMAFSDVNAVTISRFGDSEYGYHLNWFKRIISDPYLTILLPLLLGTLALVGAVRSISSGKDILAAACGLARVLRKQQGKKQSDG